MPQTPLWAAELVCIGAVLADTFDPDAEAIALLQAEARKTWDATTLLHSSSQGFSD
jgi:hypothetical protein